MLQGFSFLKLALGWTGLPAWAAEALLVLAVVGGLVGSGRIWLAVHDHRIATAARQHEDQSLKDQGDKLERQAAAQNATRDKTYADQLKQINADHDAKRARDAADLANAGDRLRAYDAYRRSHPDPVLGGTGCAAGTPAPGADRSEQMEQVALQLASALKSDDRQLLDCRAE